MPLPEKDSLADIVAEELLLHRIQKIDDKSRFILDIIEREMDKKIKAAQCQCPIE